MRREGSRELLRAQQVAENQIELRVKVADSVETVLNGDARCGFAIHRPEEVMASGAP